MKELENEEKIEIIKVITMILLIISIMIGLAIDNTYATEITSWNELRIWNQSFTRLKTCKDTNTCYYNSNSNNIYFLGGSRTNLGLKPNVTYALTGTIRLTTIGNKNAANQKVELYFNDTSGATQGKFTCKSGGITSSYDDPTDSEVTWTYHEINCQFETSNINQTGITWQTIVANWGVVTIDMMYFDLSILDDNSIIANQDKNTQEIIQNQNANQQQTNERLDSIISGQQYEKPDKNEDIENMEEQEQEIFDLFEYDPDSVTIDIDDTSTRKIFELLTRVITQNNLIQYMVITILSISIIKLVLGR